MANVCTQSSSRRFSDRSATRPAKAPMNSTGPNCAAASSPRAKPLSVSFSTRSVCAISVSQLPTCEMSWPVKKRRKLRTRREWKVSPLMRRRRVIGRSPETRASRTSSAAASCSRSPGPSSRMRPVSQAVLRWRESSRRARPASVSGDPDEAPIARIHGPRHQADRFELGHDLGDRGRRHLLVVGQRPEGERSLPLDDRERGQLARGEPGIGLLAQPAGEAGGAQPQPRRQLLLGLRGRRSGRAAGRRGHDLYFTNLISLSNHHRERPTRKCAPHAPSVARSRHSSRPAAGAPAR